MSRNTLISRIAIATGVPAAAAAAALLATAASAASSGPAVNHHAVRPAATSSVTSFATQAPRHVRSGQAEPGDARGRANEPGEDAQGRANEPGEDVQGQAGENEVENEPGDDQGAGNDQGDDNSGQSGDNSGSGSQSSGPGSDGSGDQSGSGDDGSGHHGGGGGSGDGRRRRLRRRRRRRRRLIGNGLGRAVPRLAEPGGGGRAEPTLCTPPPPLLFADVRCERRGTRRGARWRRHEPPSRTSRSCSATGSTRSGAATWRHSPPASPPSVTHRGVRADLHCPDREAVIANAAARSRQLPDVEAIELVAAGDQVVLSVRAATVGMPLERDADPDARRGLASIVFTLRDGLITAIQDYPSRADALRAAGAAEALWG